MNGVLAAAGAALATVLYWCVAAGAAGRRRMEIGSLPPWMLALVAATSGAAASTGVAAPAVLASAGAGVAAIVDLRTGSIFDPLTAAIIVSSCALGAINGTLVEGVRGTASVGGALFTVYGITNGRGLGLGDVKLGAALGMALGLAGGLAALAFAFVCGGSYGAWLLATKRARAGTPIRFGPFMAAGTFAVLLAPLGNGQ